MKNAINNQVGMLGEMFLWLVANLKQGVIYFIEQACGNDILASVYSLKQFLMNVIHKELTFSAFMYRFEQATSKHISHRILDEKLFSLTAEGSRMRPKMMLYSQIRFGIFLSR